ncbi:M48 family metalloprotease [Flavobacterium sp. J372]|uniref:M48 family metalloprotease n=1 Tax=Flavobacterium sp. J372 TaxID=2898436 RepID=UPI00215150AC|nr:M48 family metalloprotease [Flavobacterium sp. J372]MCR5862940.1 M48 family metalloprotease [Flavobacterium sp. J372]
MARIITFLLLSLISVYAQPTKRIQVDTADIAYRTSLKNLYRERTAATLSSFKNMPDKKLGKAMAGQYEKVNSEFIAKIDEGTFVKAAYYEEKINSLFSKIVETNPQFTALASTKILLSFDEAPNAYAIGDGFVIIHLPLFSHLTKEHEIAFVLCHELAHNLLNHPQNGLKEYSQMMGSSEIAKQTREIEKRKYNKGEGASGLYKQIIYGNRKKRREVEFQADSLGFVLYRNAFAGKEAIAVKSFGTLEHIDKEKDSLQPKDFERLFSSASQPFKPEWLANDEINGYKYDKNPKFWQVDSLKTHPDCNHRSQRLAALFGIKTDGSQLTDNAYKEVALQAKYDQLLGLYVLKEYGKSLYETLLLLKDNEGDVYLKQMVQKNLLRIQEAQKNYTMNKYVDTVNPRYSNSYNTFLSFLRQLRKSEMTQIINQYSN